MTELQQKQLDFLNDTVNHFNNHNRGLIEGNCCYAGGCAIGRKIDDKELCLKLDSYKKSSINYWFVFKMIPDNLKELGKDFLSDIQKLHDDSIYWSSTGLSNFGRNKYLHIIKKYNLE